MEPPKDPRISSDSFWLLPKSEALRVVPSAYDDAAEGNMESRLRHVLSHLQERNETYV